MYVELRTQHYLSFHPNVGYWLPLDKAEELARHAPTKVRVCMLIQLPHTRASYEDMLRGPLVSLDDDATFRTMPQLKAYLARRFASQHAADHAHC